VLVRSLSLLFLFLLLELVLVMRPRAFLFFLFFPPFFFTENVAFAVVVVVLGADALRAFCVLCWCLCDVGCTSIVFE
jgi:hypothetical protein